MKVKQSFSLKYHNKKHLKYRKLTAHGTDIKRRNVIADIEFAELGVDHSSKLVLGSCYLFCIFFFYYTPNVHQVMTNV